jgi:hypothetical protein
VDYEGAAGFAATPPPFLTSSLFCLKATIPEGLVRAWEMVEINRASP